MSKVLPTIRHLKQKGYTLVELLLYISIIGILLASATSFFGTVLEARIKNESISEVEQQGAFVMDCIVRTIRNADSITSPVAGANAASLTLAVPTAALSPTVFDMDAGSAVLGYNVVGTSTDSSDSNFMNATKFTASASGTVSTLFARIGATVGASPNNKAQMAIYSGTTQPSTLLASSGDTALTASAWNAFTISPVSVTSGQTYWLAYNTNGTSSAQNNLTYHAGAANQSQFTDQTYGSWQPSWTGGANSNEFSMYATIVTGGGSGALQIKEGTGATVALTNGKVTVQNLTFTNLSRGSTPGVVRVSFTISRNNSTGKNEYDYQKTFTTSAAVR